jgi:putative ABC transport system permease protein
VTSLDRKLLRDLRLMWSQVLTIALVVASGVAGFITTLSAVDSLAIARDRFYAQGHFADVFASVKRAPNSFVEQLQQIPGVADVQTTVEKIVRIEIEGVADPISGQLIGIDPRSPRRLNLVTVSVGGNLPDRADVRSGDTIDALVSAGFANARQIEPGSVLIALMNGKRRALRIVGIALSPEYVFASMSGMPDQRGFGVFWVNEEALASAYDMRGAFNRVAIKLAPGASESVAISALNQRISPFGGREAHGRDDQSSHRMLDLEIKEQYVLGTMLPAIFLAVAAFLLNVVVSRLVSTQREQIATLKALGYSNRAIGLHYLKLVLIIVSLGLVLGVSIGKWLGQMFTGLYANFFFFPSFEHRIAPWLILASALITIVTAAAGTLNAIVATVRLAPAEAMRPPSPGRYRRTVLERLGLTRISTSIRMILRQMERRPWRSALSIGGIAAAVAIVVLGNFFRDAIDTVVDTQFNVVMRGDITISVAEAVNDNARHQIERLTGVYQVESGRDVAVRFINGHRQERSSVQGFAARPRLRRVVDADFRETSLPETGLVMTDRLAAKLGLRIGDNVQFETLEGTRKAHVVRLVATTREMMGLNAYMQRDALNRLTGDDNISSQFSVAIERGREDDFLRATRSMPTIVGAFSKATLLRNMQEVSARNIRIMSTVLTVFATIIAVGVVYNNARIALAERSWELASLRVLGFSRAEVSAFLLGELAISIAVALPLGMLLGFALAHLLVEFIKSDQFFFPVTIRPRTYAWAAICVVLAGAATALVVRRRIDRLDMVAALKTRE